MSAPDRVAAGGPLELLHPSGAVDKLLLAGERWPVDLLPPRADRAGADVELAVIAPSAAQVARRGWLGGALDTAARALADDGLLYAVLPPPVRGAARRRLRALGLELTTPIVQLPARAPRYLVPLAARPWSHMLTREIGAHARLRRALVTGYALPSGSRLLAESLPGAALTARRPGAAPAAAWLDRLTGEAPATQHVAALTSWRGPLGSVVLFCFADGDHRPWGVAKVGAGATLEAQALGSLAPAARAAGAEVPHLLATGAAGDRPVLVGSAVGGAPAARALMADPTRFAEVSRRIAAWIEGWNATTARAGTLSGEELARDLLDDDVLEGQLPERYRDWLAGHCDALDGSALPRVAAHHDLSMWNVRLTDQGGLGLIDWAEARADALPLTDLFYAIADAAAACDGYRDRAAAVRACFEPGGARAATVTPLVERLSASLDLAPATAELCFHACWLRHSANERRADAGDGQFAAVVRWLAHRTGTS